jgi:hypothetical protein
MPAPENPDQQITLAPAAGSGIGKALADALLKDPEFLPMMVAAAKGGLEAVRSWWDKGSQAMASEPDYRTRIQALALILAHMEGEPVKRIIHQHLGAAGGIDLKATLRESPELAALLAAELEKANWRKSGRNGKAKPVAAVETH